MEKSLSTTSKLLRLLLCILLGLVLLLILFPSVAIWWPPVSVERRRQKEILTQRVEAAGGWDAVRRDCITFAGQNPNGFYSHFMETNGLPPAILALKPMLVQYVPAYGCVQIRIFGMHRTGGHSTPYFGLEVDTSSNNVTYHHGTGYENGGVIGNHDSVPQQVANGIYEIY